MEVGLKKTQQDLTNLYQSLMENEGIGSSRMAGVSDHSIQQDQAELIQPRLLGLPQKVKNNIHFNIIRLNDSSKAEAPNEEGAQDGTKKGATMQ